MSEVIAMSPATRIARPGHSLGGYPQRDPGAAGGMQEWLSGGTAPITAMS